MLGKVVKESQRDWDDRLPQVMSAYRASIHSATGYSPNRLFLGRETRMPLDLIMGIPTEVEEPPQSTDAYVQKIKEKTEAAYEIARQKLRVAAERRKETYDIKSYESRIFRKRLGLVLVSKKIYEEVTHVAKHVHRTICNCSSH